MKQYQITTPGAALALVESDDPQPTGTEVLVRTLRCGVCHSDVHLHEGGFDLGGGRVIGVGEPGLAMGHEIFGEVIAHGPDAEDVAVGDLRVVYPWIGCGDCPTCKRGDENICLAPRSLGVNVDGGFGDRVLVPHSRYLFDAGDVDPSLAATYACSGLTAYSALKRVGRLPEDEDLVIVGAGGLGMMAIRIGVAVFGHAPIVVDIDDAKLEEADAAGARAVINSKDESAAKRLKGLTDGGAFAAIDFVGSEISSSFALSVLRKGGKLVIVGLFGGQFTMPLPFFPWQARTVEGVQVGNLDNMRELMAMVREGRIEPIRINERPLEDATDVLNELRDGQVVGRIVLVVD